MSTYGNAVVIGRVGCEDDGDTDDATEEVGEGPPGIFREWTLNICNDRSDERDEPSELERGQSWLTKGDCNSYQ